MLSRSGEDGLSIPTGWFAVANHDTSDMLTTSGVTELLARAKGKPIFNIFYLESPSPKLVSTPLPVFGSPGHHLTLLAVALVSLVLTQAWSHSGWIARTLLHHVSIKRMLTWTSHTLTLVHKRYLQSVCVCVCVCVSVCVCMYTRNENVSNDNGIKYRDGRKTIETT